MAPPVSIGALLQSELIEDSVYKEEGLCVLGIFGKSALQSGCTKETLVNVLADKRVFPGFGVRGETDCGDTVGATIQAHYSQENRVLFLVLTSVLDNRQLLRACESLTAGLAHADVQEVWKGAEKEHCLQLLFLFSVCHVLLLVHPTCTFDVTYDRLFRALDALRQKALPLLRGAITDCPVSKEWKANCRPCPPRLLFIFQMNGALQGLGGNPNDPAGGDKPKKHSPRRRLQHALEDQIYRIFRKSRVLTNQSSNCLFTVPSNQAFVYVIPGPEDDPVGSLLCQLRANCALRDSDSSVSGPGQRRYRDMRHSSRQPSFNVDGTGMASGGQLVDCTLKDFLWQHVDLVLTKKGFDDSVGRNPQPAHFELPDYSKWAQVATRLYRVTMESGDDETSLRVPGHLKVLEGFLDADAKFSENRCQKALPLAHSAYQSNLPHNYTTTVHKNQLAQALRVYSQHARGVAFQRYALQLHEDCYKFWSNGHQLCEERSLTDQHCVHKFHLLPKPGKIRV